MAAESAAGFLGVAGIGGGGPLVDLGLDHFHW